MHIKTGSWEASNTVCESDTLCDPAVLVATTNPEPHIRNRRLSPGSGICGGGGGGGCISGGESRHLSPGAELYGPGHVHTLGRQKERTGPQHKGRSLRREISQKGLNRFPKVNQKERWVEDSLLLLKPPPAFPVQDSPAKLQPAVSYASKVKAKTASGILEDDRPAIGVLLQNQWGLSFISETRPAPESANSHPGAADSPAPQPTDTQAPVEPPLAIQSPDEPPRPFTTSTSIAAAAHPELDEHNGELLLSCRHLVEALNFHNREWNAICNQQKRDPKRVVWYKDFQEHPA
ncbi:uncharacterized protein LOC144035438 [Vanacampus margaritifer]